LSGAVEKPVGEKFKLKMFHPVVIKDRFHFFERMVVQNMFQLGMPDTNALKTSLSGGFDSIFEIKAAYLTNAWKNPRSGPIQRHQLYVLVHGGIFHAGLQ